MKSVMKFILPIFSLLLTSQAYADNAGDVEMALTVAPYILAIDDDKPFRTAGKVFASQLVSTISYVAGPRVIDAWPLAVGTNIALLCNLQEKEACYAGIVAGSYVLYHRSQFSTEAAVGLTIGIASGSLVPGIVANF